MTEGRTEPRLKLLAGLVAFMFAALTTRLWFLQVLTSAEAREKARNNYVHLVESAAPRGRIIDDQGNVLVENRTTLVVTVNRQEAGDGLESDIYTLSKLLGISAEEIARRVESPLYYENSPVPVASHVSKKVAFYIGEHQGELPGVTVARVPVRTYPQGSLAAHVLGYLGQVSPDQLQDPAFEAYEPGDRVGKTGVEAEYEHFLRGTDGVTKYRVNSAGEILEQLSERPPEPGDDLVLTLSSDIQGLAEESLQVGLEHARRTIDPTRNKPYMANAGAVVVLDPTTGAIKALASSPSYDPTFFVRPHTSEQYEQMFGAATGYPLLNRAIQGQYPPGSTYKPFVLLSALRRGIADTSAYYPCPPFWEVPEDPLHESFDNWSKTDWGSISLSRALFDSCDTVFYPIGYQYWRIYYPPTSPPKEPLQEDLKKMGFGSATNVDIPYEKAGRVPTPEWKAEWHRNDPENYPSGKWFPGDFINMSIGQGDTLVTPLQIAQAFATIMNNGRECVPHIAQRIQKASGEMVMRIRDHCGRRVPFTHTQLEYVRNALAQVPIQGTAASAFRGFPFSQVWIAGKTGTAQVTGWQDYSWFAAMASAEGKEYVVVALVEQGGHGSMTAAPIVRRVVEGLYGLPMSGFLSGGATD
ncbi:MAG: penicillin-binding protein 2 [Actinomycetota bacterium]